MAKAKPKGQVGSSAFTHQDDAGATLHPSNPEHAEALLFGGTVSEDRDEIVLGPGAFGSPDPRTLGHVMQPATGPSRSAAKLDPAFSHLQEPGAYAGQADEEQLGNMTKEELTNYADQRGIEYSSSMKKDELIDAITEHQDSQAEETEGEGEEQPANYEEMTKAELLEEAKSRGVEDVSDSNTKDEIISALEDSENDSE